MRRNSRTIWMPFSRAFTIVELLIVVVIIAILASIVVVGYNGVRKSATDATAKSDLGTATTKLEMKKVESGSYPNTLADVGVTDSTQTSFQLTGGANDFCVSAVSKDGASMYHTSSFDKSIKTGVCTGHAANPIPSGPITKLSGSLADRVTTISAKIRSEAQKQGRPLSDYFTSDFEGNASPAGIARVQAAVPELSFEEGMLTDDAANAYGLEGYTPGNAYYVVGQSQDGYPMAVEFGVISEKKVMLPAFAMDPYIFYDENFEEIAPEDIDREALLDLYSSIHAQSYMMHFGGVTALTGYTGASLINEMGLGGTVGSGPAGGPWVLSFDSEFIAGMPSLATCKWYYEPYNQYFLRLIRRTCDE